MYDHARSCSLTSLDAVSFAANWCAEPEERLDFWPKLLDEGRKDNLSDANLKTEAEVIFWFSRCHISPSTIAKHGQRSVQHCLWFGNELQKSRCCWCSTGICLYCFLMTQAAGRRVLLMWYSTSSVKWSYFCSSAFKNFRWLQIVTTSTCRYQYVPPENAPKLFIKYSFFGTEGGL